MNKRIPPFIDSVSSTNADGSDRPFHLRRATALSSANSHTVRTTFLVLEEYIKMLSYT